MPEPQLAALRSADPALLSPPAARVGAPVKCLATFRACVRDLDLRHLPSPFPLPTLHFTLHLETLSLFSLISFFSHFYLFLFFLHFSPPFPSLPFARPTFLTLFANWSWAFAFLCDSHSRASHLTDSHTPIWSRKSPRKHCLDSADNVPVTEIRLLRSRWHVSECISAGMR